MDTHSLTRSIQNARAEGDALRQALDKMDINLSPLALLAAAVAEYYVACAEDPSLPPMTPDVFAGEVSAMAKALALIEHKIAALDTTMPEFSDLPVDAFVVPGPAEPQ